MPKSICIVLLLVLGSMVHAQLPNTDLYMFSFVESDKGLRLTSPKFLSGFNKTGYNNQPAFLSSNRLLVTTNARQKDQTDIILLDLDEEKLRYITKTSVNEFSPTLMPDGRNISVIRQDGKDQWLWQYPRDQSDGGNKIFRTLNDVGYHCWFNNESVGLFRVTDPISFSIGNVKTQVVENVLNDIGRCLKLNDQGELVFVHKVTEDFWYLKSFNFSTNKIKIISEIDDEDFEILSSGSYLIGKESKLYILQEGDDNWKEVADLAEYGIKDITRITSYRNKLIFVNKK